MGISAWPKRALKDCAVWFSGGTPNKSTAKYWGGSIPWISAKSVTRFFIDHSEQRVTEEGARNGTRLVPANTILFIVRGMSLKSEFRIGITTRPVTFNQDLKALIAVDGVLPAFLAYAIKSKTADILGLVGEAGHGTGVLPTDRIQGLEIPVPPFEEQCSIASVLSALDDKIDLNRRMNETLEELARTLFKSWFVDFDPVRAKAKGRHPVGMDAETAALFPNRFVESELGEIPEGWKLLALASVVELNPTRQIQRGTQAPYVEMASLPTRGHRPSGWPLREVGSGARFTHGDTLFARITPCLENGKTGFVDFLSTDEVGWGSTEYIVIRPKPPLPYEWGYLLARDPAFRSFAVQHMEGTTGRQRVSANAVGQYVVTLGSVAVCAAFAERVKPLFTRMGANANEDVTLAELRDLLLPKLISGELRVREAEKLAEAAL